MYLARVYPSMLRAVISCVACPVHVLCMSCACPGYGPTCRWCSQAVAGIVTMEGKRVCHAGASHGGASHGGLGHGGIGHAMGRAWIAWCSDREEKVAT